MCNLCLGFLFYFFAIIWYNCHYVSALISNHSCMLVAAVRKEISDETDRETGRSKQISTVPIHLSIYSPNGEIPILITPYILPMDMRLDFTSIWTIDFKPSNDDGICYLVDLLINSWRVENQILILIKLSFFALSNLEFLTLSLILKKFSPLSSLVVLNDLWYFFFFLSYLIYFMTFGLLQLWI